MTNTEDTPKHRAPNEALNLTDLMELELRRARRESLVMPIEPDSDVVEETHTWFKRDTLALRMWVYKVAMAVLVIIAGWQGWQAVSTQDWLNLIEAVLALSGAGVANMARKNVR